MRYNLVTLVTVIIFHYEILYISAVDLTLINDSDNVILRT